MLRGILSPAFLQAAGRAGKSTEQIVFRGSTAYPELWSLVGQGDIFIESTYNGQTIEVEYNDPDFEGTPVSIQADANTDVIIKGHVTRVEITDDAWADLTSIDTSKAKSLEFLSLFGNGSLSSLDVSKNTALIELYCAETGITSLDVSKNTALNNLYCSSTGITSLDVSKNTALTVLSCDNTGLTSLDLSHNTAMDSLSCNGCTALIEIKYNASNNSVSTNIANAITAATADDGVVYTDSNGAYYNTIATAATDKGWTIEQL